MWATDAELHAQGLWTCWVPAGVALPSGCPDWWASSDGQGHRGYAPASADRPGWEWLQPVLCLPGASAGALAVFHYVVETDVPAAADADFNAWYNQEHLPGLAAVPGTVQARRYTRLTGGPRYVAMYDLVTPMAMESAAWLAVRHTPWSGRVRPLFQNTRRTLFERAAPT